MRNCCGGVGRRGRVIAGKGSARPPVMTGSTSAASACCGAPPGWQSARQMAAMPASPAKTKGRLDRPSAAAGRSAMLSASPFVVSSGLVSGFSSGVCPAVRSAASAPGSGLGFGLSGACRIIRGIRFGWRIRVGIGLRLRVDRGGHLVGLDLGGTRRSGRGPPTLVTSVPAAESSTTTWNVAVTIEPAPDGIERPCQAVALKRCRAPPPSTPSSFAVGAPTYACTPRRGTSGRASPPKARPAPRANASSNAPPAR